MFTKTLLVAAAAAGAVNASPIVKRQTVSTNSVTATVTVDTSSSMSSSMMSSSMMSSSMMPSSTEAYTPGINPQATMVNPAGNGTSNAYPLYPCPYGFSLTYVQNNVTLEKGIGEVKDSLGEWATASIFPNVTSPQGGSSVNATHTFMVMGANFSEVLVNTTANDNDGSAYLQWVWNSTAAILAGDLEIATYSTVFKVYDPEYHALGHRSNETFLQIFTNACAANQTLAHMTLEELQAVQLDRVNGTVLRSTVENGNGGSLISSVVATNTVTTINTDSATDTNTVLATATRAVTQTDTLVPLTTRSTGTTLQTTVTSDTTSVTSTAITVKSTADTVTVTSNPPNKTATTVVATTTTSV